MTKRSFSKQDRYASYEEKAESKRGIRQEETCQGVRRLSEEGDPVGPRSNHGLSITLNTALARPSQQSNETGLPIVDE